MSGQAGGVFGRLFFDASERAFGLGLNRTDGLAVKIKQVIRKTEAGLYAKFTHRNAPTYGKVEFVATLDESTRCHQTGVTLAARLLLGGFRCHAVSICVASSLCPASCSLPVHIKHPF